MIKTITYFRFDFGKHPLIVYVNYGHYLVFETHSFTQRSYRILFLEQTMFVVKYRYIFNPKNSFLFI